MTKAVRVHKVGGPEALVYEAVDVPAPGTGEVRIRQHAVGLNFIDVYYRTGLYKAPGLPFIAGNEAAGEVLAVGPGVTIFTPVTASPIISISAAMPQNGTSPGKKLVKLPDHITYEQGAVLMLKGLTVWYLLHKTFRSSPHHRVLIHAAAGRHRLAGLPVGQGDGGRMSSAPVGSKAKADLALANGCDHVILYNDEDFAARVKQISRNELCDVVYDGVGKTTFSGLAVLPQAARNVRKLRQTRRARCRRSRSPNSTTMARFCDPAKLNDYGRQRSELLEGADNLVCRVINGKLHVPSITPMPLKDAPRRISISRDGRLTGAAILRP